MDNLLEFISKHYHWLLFVILEAASVALLFSYNGYQSSVWFSSANAVAGKCYEWSSSVSQFFSLKEVNTKLTARNTELEMELANARKQIEVLTGDTTTVMKEIPAGYRVVVAKVIQNTINLKDNLITIDKGEADGVKADMGVVSGDGVVGIVYRTGAHYSIVLPVLNSQSEISCTIRGRGYFGYLRWYGNDSQYAYVEDIPRHAHYTKGDIIETSGYSSVFPEGMMVGKVLCTFNSADGLSYRIKIRLSTDFGNLRDVAIIDNAPMQERMDILHAAQDSIAAR